MPDTKRQQRAAGAELGRRRAGAKKTAKPTKRRPMGPVSRSVLKDLASKKR